MSQSPVSSGRRGLGEEEEVSLGGTGPEARGASLEGKQDGSISGVTDGKSQEGGRGIGKGMNIQESQG